MTRPAHAPHWTTRWWFLLPATLASLVIGAYYVAGGLYTLLGMRIEVLTGRPYPRTMTELALAAIFAALGLVVIVGGFGFWTRRRAAFARMALVGLVPMVLAVFWELGQEMAATGGIEFHPLLVLVVPLLAWTLACCALARRWRTMR